LRQEQQQNYCFLKRKKSISSYFAKLNSISYPRLH
jgi:hypothetical protein